MALITLLIDPAAQAWLGQKGHLLQPESAPQDYRIDPSNPRGDKFSRRSISCRAVVNLNQRGAIVRWFDNEKTTIGIGIVVLLGCETDGVWTYARLRGALTHAVFYDPFRVWISTI